MGGAWKGPFQTAAPSDPEPVTLGLRGSQVACEELLSLARSDCLLPDVFVDFLDLEVMPCGYLYGRL